MAIGRNTKQKKIIQDIIDTKKSFFSAKDIHDSVKKVDEKIGIATIYRYLNIQVKKFNLNAYICDRKNVYSKQKTHCHFVDEETGKIEHFTIDSLDFLKNKISGEITSINIEIKGKLNIKS